MPANSPYTPGAYDLDVRRSSAGLGLFTASAIPKGACIIEYVGRILAPDEEYSSRSKYLFEVSAKKTIDGSDRTNKARYINHSCKPNCEPVVHRGRVFIMAKRKIKPEEELTYDYGQDYFERIIQPKGCRCSACSEKATV